MQLHFLKPFIRRVQAEGLDVHGISLFREDTLVESYRWKPDVAEDIWSHTKCFLSAAIGVAVEEGKLRLSDRVSDLLPDCLPENPDDRLLRITLRHLLTMSSGFGQGILFGQLRDNLDAQYELLPKDIHHNPMDLGAYILTHSMQEEPGTSFTYSNGDANLAARMLEKATGMSLQNYVYYRLLRPMGIPYPAWGRDLGGHCYGDASLELRTNHMACLGRLYLNDGLWQGERLLSKSWIAESSRKQIDTPENLGKPDIWRCGYGYLIWQFPHPNAYRFSGAYGQNSLMFPDEGIQISFQSFVQDLNKLKRIVNEELVARLM